MNTIIDGKQVPIPKKHTFSNGSQTGNFDAMSEEIHIAEGFHHCLPDSPCNTETHKLSEWELVGNNWVRHIVKVTPGEVIANELKVIIAARILEYPSMQDQFDMIFWDKKNNTQIWVESIQAVKDKHPKP